MRLWERHPAAPPDTRSAGRQSAPNPPSPSRSPGIGILMVFHNLHSARAVDACGLARERSVAVDVTQGFPPGVPAVSATWPNTSRRFSTHPQQLLRLEE